MVTRRMLTLLLVCVLALSLAAASVLAGHNGSFGGGPPSSAGNGQYCNAGSGNGDESPNPGTIECDPGNSPTHNNANDKENPPGVPST